MITECENGSFIVYLDSENEYTKMKMKIEYIIFRIKQHLTNGPFGCILGRVYIYIYI